jgi:hypothetical protein
LIACRSSITTNHLTKLVLLGELSAEDFEVMNQGLGALDQGILGADDAVGLNAELKLGEEGVGNW